MNDRFKFRVWDKENKKFLHYLSFDISSNGILILFGGIEGKKYLDVNDTDRYVLMQSTGLKDKNGKLIYEGDIVSNTRVDWKYEEYTRYYIVCWDRTQWQLGLLKYQRPKSQNNRRYDRKVPFKDIVSFSDYTPIKEFAECEIIGNIYENKDLLND